METSHQGRSPRRPAGIDAYPDRSRARSAAMLLRMPPEFLRRLDAAAAAAGRPRMNFVLETLEQALPPELDMTVDNGAQEQEDVRMAG